MTASRIGSLLDGLTETRALTRQARQLLAIQQQVRAILPGELASSTSVGSLSDGQLVLLTENGAAAAKLRHLAPKILRTLAQRDRDVTAIHVRVQVTKRVNSLPQKQNSVGPAGREALRALVRQLPPSALRRAVRRLSGAGAIASDYEQEAFEGKQKQEHDDKE
jgi:hypothetical protein